MRGWKKMGRIEVGRFSSGSDRMWIQDFWKEVVKWGRIQLAIHAG
jgi:hypothetical protein